jgi:hypothetical protein
VTYVAAQIQVTASPESDAPTLPEWGVIVMGGLLLTSMMMKQRQ